jgi:hypothetical protein
MGPSAETSCATEESVAAGLEGYGIGGLLLRDGGRGRDRGGGRTTLQLAVCDHRARQGGFDGSASAKLTGPIPQIAMTAG